MTSHREYHNEIANDPDSTSGPNYSYLAHDDGLESRIKKKLGDTSFWTDFEVQISRGDGHCFMHSVTRFFEELEVTSDITKLHQVSKRLEVETVSNIDYYIPFIPCISNDQLIREMSLYINDKVYDTKFGDLAPLITSNSLAIHIMIISEMENGEFSTDFVHPRENEKAKAIIFVYKSGDHYNACVPKDIIAKRRLALPLRNTATLAESPELKTALPEIDLNPRQVNVTSFNANMIEGPSDVRHNVIDGELTVRPIIAGSTKYMEYLSIYSYIQIANVSCTKQCLNETGLFSNILKQFRAKHAKNLVACHLNINGVRSKFTEVAEILSHNTIDILFLSETKIDSSFPIAQFCVHGFKNHRADRNSCGGGVMALIRNDIPHRRRPDLERLISCPIESMFIECIIKKEKWMFICFYSPHNKFKSNCCDAIDTAMNAINSESIHTYFVLGDINTLYKHDRCTIYDLLDIYDMTNIITLLTCYKSAENPTATRCHFDW